MSEWKIASAKRHYLVNWALLAGSSLFLVCSIGYRVNVNRRVAANSIAATPVASVSADKSAGLDDRDNLPAAPALAKAFNAKLSTDLTGKLSVWAAQQSGSQQWAVSVRSLDDDDLSASVHGDQTFGSASIFKLYLVYSLTKTVPFSTWSTQKIDNSHSYADCVQAMMIASDNQCAVEIGNKLGWAKVSAMLPSAGYTHTSLKADPMSTSANDTAQILGNIYHRDGFSDDVSSFLLDAMSHSKFRKGIVAGCPDCQVANKTGDIDGNLHDAAVIIINGKHYALAIFSKGGSQKQIAAVTTMVHDFIVSAP